MANPSHSNQISTAVLQELAETARDASTRAYAPYSDFPVGAAVLLSNGEIFSGANVENASYGLTICAERVAIGQAVAHTEGIIEIKAIVVFTPTDEPTPPCGACRQVINEFGPKAEVFSIGNGLDLTAPSISLDQLLPRAFGPHNLSEEKK